MADLETAYHEAGHIVMGFVVGYVPRGDIRCPQPGCEGVTWECGQEGDYKLSALLVGLAGMAAERRQFKSSWEELITAGGARDWAEAQEDVRLAINADTDEPHFTVVMDAMKQAAEQSVAIYWSAVEGIAKRLLEDDRPLEAEECFMLMSHYLQGIWRAT